MALAPQSNALYTAFHGEVKAEIEAHRAEPVPLHLRNAPTPLMEQLCYGEGYQYAHDVEAGVADMECMPDNLRGREFYHPPAQGRESKLLAQRMDGDPRHSRGQASRQKTRNQIGAPWITRQTRSG